MGWSGSHHNVNLGQLHPSTLQKGGVFPMPKAIWTDFGWLHALQVTKSSGVLMLIYMISHYFIKSITISGLVISWMYFLEIMKLFPWVSMIQVYTNGTRTNQFIFDQIGDSFGWTLDIFIISLYHHKKSRMIFVNQFRSVAIRQSYFHLDNILMRGHFVWVMRNHPLGYVRSKLV